MGPMMARRAGRGRSRPARPAPNRLLRRLRRWLFYLLAGVLVGPAFLILVFRVIDPPVTPLMLIRLIEGHGHDHDWVPADAIAGHLADAVIAAEDNRFCEHGGVDWQAVGEAWRDWQGGERLRGASTITMQTAKNLFLWPDRGWLRKALEAWLTVQIELLWPKQRILEVYLNIAEWGPGIYGAEAAARRHFGREAATLTLGEAGLLATALPNPLGRAAGQPNSAHVRSANRIVRRIASLGPLLACAQEGFARR